MAGEILFAFVPSKTAYFLVFDRTGRVWNNSLASFETYLTANLANYALSATQLGSASVYYQGSFPAAVAAGVYGVSAKQQIGGSPAESDPTIAGGDYQWGGAATVPLADLATSGQLSTFAPIRLARGTMIKNFPFKFVSSADHNTPFVSGIVSGQISRDGGAFGALQSGAFAEIGLGYYNLQALTSGDLLANTVALSFSATGISGGTADARDMVIVLQRTSGQ